ncbi:MAG TPA: hypothetical protein VMP68_06210 [Candidatus Eisenbacteria bacterium]|nr:hypothetical protein [Candidatus Eisenbacteria bacterium]
MKLTYRPQAFSISTGVNSFLGVTHALSLLSPGKSPGIDQSPSGCREDGKKFRAVRNDLISNDPYEPEGREFESLRAQMFCQACREW